MKLLFVVLVYAAVLVGLSVNGRSSNEWKSRIVYQVHKCCSFTNCVRIHAVQRIVLRVRTYTNNAYTYISLSWNRPSMHWSCSNCRMNQSSDTLFGQTKGILDFNFAMRMLTALQIRTYHDIVCRYYSLTNAAPPKIHRLSIELTKCQLTFRSFLYLEEGEH